MLLLVILRAKRCNARSNLYLAILELPIEVFSRLKPFVVFWMENHTSNAPSCVVD